MERMKRKKETKPKGKASAVLTADLHLTSASPVSRTDNYIQAQGDKLKFLQALSRKNNYCPILCAGDIFDHWKASPWLCAWAHLNLPENIVAIPGNHDLPMNNIEQYEKSALHLLEYVGGEMIVLKNEWADLLDTKVFGVPFNCAIGDFNEPKDKKARRILMIHAMVWENKKPAWATAAYSAKELLDEYGDHFDLILTGDNHQSFVVDDGNSVLVNPGSMMRRTAEQEDFRPRCFLYYEEDNSVEPVYFPIEENVHDVSHLDKKKERDARREAYISKMKTAYSTSLSFQDNLQAFFAENQTPKKVREIIWEHLDPTKI